MKALMAANQLAALQQEQLLQIRELLLQEQQLAPQVRRLILERDTASGGGLTLSAIGLVLTRKENDWPTKRDPTV
jgi:hypothetical protein